jgi:hypothetical protein
MRRPLLAFVEDAVVQFGQDLIALPGGEGLRGAEGLCVGQERFLEDGREPERTQAGEGPVRGIERPAEVVGPDALRERARQAPAPVEKPISPKKV